MVFYSVSNFVCVIFVLCCLVRDNVDKVYIQVYSLSTHRGAGRGEGKYYVLDFNSSSAYYILVAFLCTCKRFVRNNGGCLLVLISVCGEE